MSDGVRVRERGRLKATFRILSNGEGCKNNQLVSRLRTYRLLSMHNVAERGAHTKDVALGPC